MSKKLWIFEKPSVAKCVAELLPKPHNKKNGYIETGDGIVTWCFGHLLEQVQPKEYDEKYAKWDLDILPVIPEQWKLKPTKGKEAQLKVISDLLKNKDVTTIVNGGDEGREGQLLIDEVLKFYKNKKPVLRYLSGANDTASVKKAMNNLQDNNKFINHYNAALGRSHADWIIGMNGTMGMTSQLNKQQNNRTLVSIGRVQTPTLALVVKRDLEIENFVPQTYYALSAQFISENIPFWTRWLPKGKTLDQLEKQDKKEFSGEFDDEEDEVSGEDNSTPWLKDSKIIDKAKAKEIFDRIKQSGKGEVVDYINKPAKESQPLPNDLGELQKIMNNRYNYNVSDTLKACQELYEAGYTTYPRTDCRYLPEVQFEDATHIFSSLKANGIFEDLVDNVDLSIKSACWNDKKIGEHHAIIPTQKSPILSSLTEIQRRVYEDIVKKYIAIFYPECLVDKTKVEIVIADERFSASGRVVKSPGWRVVFGAEENNDKSPTLPSMSKGQVIPLKDLKNEEKQTTPPPHYSQGSLIGVMQNIHRILDNPEERKRLKGEGLGRSATRDTIINTLYDRNYVRSSGKYLISTDLGRVVIKSAPVALTSPSLTAQWEKALDMVSDGKFTLEQFEKKQHEFIKIILDTIKKTTLPKFPESQSSGYSAKPSSGKSSSGTPAKKSSGKKCPQCKKGNLISRKITKGENAGKSFKGCSNYPECKYTEWPKK